MCTQNNNVNLIRMAAENYYYIGVAARNIQSFVGSVGSMDDYHSFHDHCKMVGLLLNNYNNVGSLMCSFHNAHHVGDIDPTLAWV